MTAGRGRLFAFAWVGVSVGLLVAVLVLNIYGMSAGPADGLTYLAAGERLNAGHPLYALSPGDRPVVIKPPFWTVPLLSPPPIAVLFRPLAALPNELGLALWWLGAMAVIAAVLLGMLRARPAFAATAILVFLMPLVFQIPTANVNGYVLGAVVAAWLLVRAGHDAPAGVVLALAAAMKITPVVLFGWLLAQRRTRGVVAFVATGAAIAVISLLGAGLQNHLAYLDVVVDTSAVGSTQFSLAGLLRRVGVPAEIARFAPWAVVLGGFAIMFLKRDRPDVTFTVGVFTMVWGSPVMNFDWLAIMLGALAPGFWPWPRQSAVPEGSRRASERPFVPLPPANSPG